MTTGRSTQLTRQIGEHLVAAEFGRIGFVAVPFAGNVPHFDLLVANEAGFSIPVQVRAINGGSWQFDATTLLNIEIKNGRQKVLGPKLTANPGLVCILVYLRGAGKDEFITTRFRDLQDYFASTYKGGRRKKNPESTHCVIQLKDIRKKFKNWNPLLRAFKRRDQKLVRERKPNSK